MVVKKLPGLVVRNLMLLSQRCKLLGQLDIELNEHQFMYIIELSNALT